MIFLLWIIGIFLAKHAFDLNYEQQAAVMLLTVVCIPRDLEDKEK